MDKRIEKLERLKENIKNPDFKKAVEDKIDKIKETLPYQKRMGLIKK